MIHTFFRIVTSNPPTEDDFKSQEALGIPLFDQSTEKREMWRGISVFSTLTQARNKARAYPGKGQHLAILEIDEDGPIRWARTGNQRGHFTLWSDPGTLLASVVAVVGVSFEVPEPGGRDTEG